MLNSRLHGRVQRITAILPHCGCRHFRTLAGIVAPVAENASANRDNWPAEAGARSIVVEPPTQQAAMTVTLSPTSFADCR
jgi:hypothetical protein